jgi:hypothetical protein
VKLFDTLGLNARNFLTNGLKEAFDAARAGGESELLDRMFKGINVAGAGYGPVGTVFNGVLQTGAMHLRALTTVQSALANGQYANIAGTLNTLNYNRSFTGNAGLPVIPTGVQGAILRYNGFPENFISANPQFSTIGLRTNLDNSNYHAMQAQFTMRPRSGISYQGTFTWARSMGSPPNGGFANPADRREYGLLFGHRLYEFKNNGIFELPVGPGKLLLRDSHGWDCAVGRGLAIVGDLQSRLRQAEHHQRPADAVCRDRHACRHSRRRCSLWKLSEQVRFSALGRRCASRQLL